MSRIHSSNQDLVLNIGAQTATIGGAAGAVSAWHLSLPEWAAIVSMTIAVLGFVLQLVLVVRTFVRDAREARTERDAARTEREEQRAERVVTRRDRGGP